MPVLQGYAQGDGYPTSLEHAGTASTHRARREALLPKTALALGPR